MCIKHGSEAERDAIAAARARLGAAAVVGGAGGEAALSAMPDFGVGDAEATAALNAAKQGASDAPDAFLSAAETLTAALGSAADWGGDLASSYMVDVHELADLVAAAGGAVASLFDWNLVEVVRDFAQLVGLLFSTFLSLRKNPFGYLVTLANLDLSYTIPSIDMGAINTLLILMAMLCVVVFIRLEWVVQHMHAPDEIRDMLPLCASLRLLGLKRNQLGTAGAMALARAHSQPPAAAAQPWGSLACPSRER